MKQRAKHSLVDKRQKMVALLALTLLVLVMITTVNTTTTGTTHSIPHQDNNDNNAIREGSPSSATYWAETYGGSFGTDAAYCVQQTLDGGYVVAGYTTSFGAGSGDFWVLKLNSTGGVTWQKSYGGSDYDVASSVEQTSDGGYIVAGSTESFGVSSPYWVFQDAWVLKLGAGGDIVWDARSGASTQNTNVTPSDSSAITFVTSVTPANSTAIVKNTGVAPHDTQATVRVQSPPPAPTIDQPSNIAYAVGQTGYNITWCPSSQIPEHYTISVNGSSPTSYSWNGGAITYSVDGWSAGTYGVNCTVYDTLGRSVTSAVIVVVSPIDDTPVVVVGTMITTILVSVIVALVLRRMKKPLGAVEKSTASAKPPGTKIQTKFRNMHTMWKGNTDSVRECPSFGAKQE